MKKIVNNWSIGSTDTTTSTTRRVTASKVYFTGLPGFQIYQWISFGCCWNWKPITMPWTVKARLHCTSWKPRASNVAEVAELPMDAGCHLNQPDINGVTSLQLFRQMHDRLTAEGLLDTAPNLEELIHPVVLPLTCYCAKLFVSTNFLSNNLFRPLSSHSSKNMANCHEVGAHAEQIFQIAFIVVLKKIHVLLLCFRAYTERVE